MESRLERSGGCLRAACLRRDKKALLRECAKSFSEIFPERPVDLDIVKRVAAFYAKKMHGWEVNW